MPRQPRRCRASPSAWRPRRSRYGPLSGVTFGAAAFTVTATSSSGLAVSFTSATPLVCAVSGSTVTPVAVGTCSIAAGQNGNASYGAAAPVVQSFAITQASQVITFAAPGPASLGAPLALTATSSSGLAVSFVSTTAGVCTVSGSTLTPLTAGTCSIAASQAGNANYAAAAPAVQSFTIGMASQTITFGPLSGVIFGAAAFTVTATSSSGLAVSFTSATPLVCAVSGSTVTPVAVGTCSIAAGQNGNASYGAAAPVLQSFAITQASQVITFAAPGPVSLGAPLALTATSSSGLAVSFVSTTAGVCTVSGSTLTPLTAGTCSIAASQAGNANYAAAAPAVQSFTIGMASQTITFGPLSGVTFGAAAFTVTATSSSGLAVSFTSATPLVCAVSGSTVTPVAVGTCSIAAGQNGNASYGAAAPVLQSFAITQASQVITFAAPGPVSLGVPLALTATSSSGLAVSFVSTTAGVCTVSGSTLTPLTAGTCSIAASQAGNANYAAAAPAVQSFTIGMASQTITFGPLSGVTFGAAAFTVTATSSSGLAVSFTSATPLVCAVSGSTVTPVAVGTCSIAAGQNGNASYGAAAPVLQSFAITQASQVITFAAPGPVSLGAPLALTATSSSGLAVSFTSATPLVCAVSGSTVTPVAVGTCSIAAGQNGNASYGAAAPVVQSFAITQASQVITFAAPGPVSLGAPLALTATSSSGLAVSFVSTTAGVCTVSGSTLTPLTAGTCSIAASQAGNANYAAAAPAVQSFTIGMASQTITFGPLSGVTFGAAAFTVTATSSSGLAVSFTSATPLVCAVSGSTVTPVAVGTCSIAAGQNGNASYGAAAPVVQSFVITQASQVITFAAPGPVSLGAPLALTATSSSGLAVSFVSTTAGVCTVSGSTLTPLTAGTCSIAASQAGNANYAAAAPAVQSFTIGMASQTITFGPLSGVTFGAAAFTVTATSSSGLAVSFTSATPLVCAVSGSTVTPVAVGTCSIAAGQNGNASYGAAAPVVQSFAITQASQVITFAAPGPASLGAPLALTATSSSGLAVSFVSTTAGVCTVSGSTLTPLTAGTCSIAASQAGNANYAAAAPALQSFTIGMASQTITFGPLSGVTFGAAAFTVTATSSSGLAVSFTSATPLVCAVSGSTVTPVAVGTCSIAAGQNGNASYGAAAPVLQSFAITQASQVITFAAPGPVSLGAPLALTATSSSGLAVSFVSTTAGVCTVSGSTLTPLTAGTCSIAASQAGNANYAAAAPAVQSFTIGMASQTITFGPLSGVTFGAAAFTVTATSSSGLAVSFTSATPLVCAVSGSTVTPAAVGTCSIAAGQNGNASYGAAAPVLQSFAITQASQVITFAAPGPVSLGRSTVTATSSSGLAVSFTSATPLVCAVSGSTVTPVAVGTCSIAAGQNGNASYGAAAPVVQSFAITQASQVITFAAPGPVSLGAPLALTATSSSGLAVSFVSTTAGVCTVSGSTLTPLTAGTCSIAASQAGNANYAAAAPAVQSFTIGMASQTITFGPLSGVTFGAAAFTVTATSSSGLAVSFTSATPLVCAVSGSTVTPVAVGTCSIAAGQNGNASYGAAAPVVQSFAITQASQVITFAVPGPVSLGAPLALTATSSSGLAVSFTSATPLVCAVSGSTVTPVAVGTCSIAAGQNGNASYGAAAPVLQSFAITQASQVITFAAPGPVSLGLPWRSLPHPVPVWRSVSFRRPPGSVPLADRR